MVIWNRPRQIKLDQVRPWQTKADQGRAGYNISDADAAIQKLQSKPIPNFSFGNGAKEGWQPCWLLWQNFCWIPEGLLSQRWVERKINLYTFPQERAGLALTTSAAWPANEISSWRSPWPTLMGRSMLLFTTSLRWDNKLIYWNFNFISLFCQPFNLMWNFWCDGEDITFRVVKYHKSCKYIQVKM